MRPDTPFFRERLLAFLFPFLLAAPFLGRAYFVDDSYFVEIASWLKDHPSLPYHFRADDAGPQTRGWEENGFVRMVNPLGHHYYLAFLLKLGGMHEWFLRLGCVFLACFAGLFLYELARRLTDHALLATLLTLATPVHWLTSYSLLIDGTTGFLFFGALYFFVRSLERDSLSAALISGLLMGLSTVTKYPALLIFPLSGLWLLLRWKKVSRLWIVAASWTLGLSILLAYNIWTAHLYGRPHILAASGRMVHVYGWAKFFVFFIFFSGASLVPLVVWPTFQRKGLLASVLVLLLMVIYLMSPQGGFTRGQSFLLALWLMTSFLFIGKYLSLWRLWIFPKDQFLLGWLLGFCVMMFAIMGWVAGRYYVIVIPALGFGAVRLVELVWPESAQQKLRALLIATILFTGLLAYADFNQAQASRWLVRDLQRENIQGGSTHYYLGDSFTMSYLKGQKWVPCFETTEFKPGDWVLTKDVSMPRYWFYKKGLHLRLLREFNYTSRFPLRMMDNEGSAGWYASVWGALPFTFSHSPWERFRLFEIVDAPRLPTS